MSNSLFEHFFRPLQEFRVALMCSNLSHGRDSSPFTEVILIPRNVILVCGPTFFDPLQALPATDRSPMKLIMQYCIWLNWEDLQTKNHLDSGYQTKLLYSTLPIVKRQPVHLNIFWADLSPNGSTKSMNISSFQRISRSGLSWGRTGTTR